MEKQDIFRKSAMESMVNPEELNKLIDFGISGSWVIIISITGLIISFLIWTAFSSVPLYVDGYGIILNKSKIRPVLSGVKGVIKEIEVNRGDSITDGKTLVKIEVSENTDYADKLVEVTAPCDGIIVQQWIYPSLYVSESHLLFAIEETNVFTHPKVIAYIPSDFSATVKPDMDVHINVHNLNKNVYGFIRGKVDKVFDFQTTREFMFWQTGNFQTVDYVIKKSGNKKLLIPVLITLMENRDGTYKWSQKKPPFSLQTGSLCSCSIIVGKKTPLETLINYLY